jgi:non-ribosomal peptide synthetase component F
VVPAEQEAGLRAVARRAGCGFKHLMLAAHLRTLALLTGEDDVVTGVFTHGRPEVDGGTDMIGMFLHFQPHRLRLGAQTWLGLVDEVFAADARSLPHRRYRTADLGPAAVFPALFNYTEFPAYAAVAAHDRLITDVRWFEHVDVPFLVNVGRDISQARLEVTVNADGRLLPQDVTDGIARLYTAVLAHIAEHPDAGVSDPTDEIRALTATLRGNGDEQWLPHN